MTGSVKVDAAGTYTKDSAGFEFLGNVNVLPALLFSGSSLGGGATLGYLDSSGTFVAITDGAVSALPEQKAVDAMPSEGLALQVTGSPDFEILATRYRVPNY